ncbi:MAG: hypothetical protein LBT32_07340 [Peptococcaceae bacterium]|jgi:hypothetical protein|nr:hypothetical protein [Peptococcaceae bacterium]
MTEQTTNKIQELFQDEAFLTKFTTLETLGELKAELAQNGVELSDEDLDEFGKGIKAAISPTDELSADELGDVTGGSTSSFGTAWKAGVEIGKAIKSASKLVDSKISKDIVRNITTQPKLFR